MPRRPKNNGQRWAKADDRNLSSLYKNRASVKDISHRMGRSVAAVYQRISVLGVANRRG